MNLSILAEFQEDYLTCTTTPEDWKQIEKFRAKWTVPHILGAQDGKHVAMKKPKKFGVTITIIRVLFPNAASPGGCRQQIPLGQVDLHQMNKYLFSASQRRRSRMAFWVFQHLNPWGTEGHICTVLLTDNAFVLMSTRRQLIREERIVNCRFSRGRRVVENAFFNPAK